MSEGPKGVFMVPGMEIFFRRLGEAFCAQVIFRLTFIEVARRDRRRHDRLRASAGRSSSTTPRSTGSWQQLAPGMVLVAEDIRLAIEDGCEVFDLLKGDYAYKYRFGARTRSVRRLVVSRGTAQA